MTESALAVAELMERPDPPDIKRGNNQTCAGSPRRFEQWRYLPQRFVQLRQQEKCDISEWRTM